MKISDHDMAELSKVFAPVLEWLDVEVYKKNPKVGFNMVKFNEELNAVDYNGKACDQTVCIVGYVWKHNKFASERDYGSAIIEDITKKFEFEDVENVKRVLALLATVDDEMPIRMAINFEKIKPHQAAAAIRYFLKTRKVKWKKFLEKDQFME